MPSARYELLMDHNLFRVLDHFRIAKVDYAKNITKYTEIQRPEVQSCIEYLEKEGLIEKYSNTSIKRKYAKLKKSAEVHKHHTYYEITRNGSSLVRSIGPESYLEILGEECLNRMLRKGERNSDCEECLKMIRMGIFDRNLQLTALGSDILKMASEMGKSH